MKPVFGLLIACAAAMTAAQCFAPVDARAAPVVRVKARLTAFDGQVMTLEPLPSSPKPQDVAQAKPFTVSVLPDTRYVGADKASFDSIKPGDYVGAAVTERRGGRLRAQDVYLYAEALRGTGEGRFTQAGQLIVNGVVRAVERAGPEGKQGGTVTVHYRGAVLTGLGRGRTLCEGRASPPAFASPLACESDASIEVPPDTPVSALTVGDQSLLVPGSVVTVAMTKSDGDKDVTPGVIVEKPLPVEKPPSPP